jgi:Carboxypeptidase regulatory-like domain
MRSPQRICLATVLAVLVAAGGALAADAGRTAAGSAWARISGPNNTGLQLGLARTPDGVLNVIWNRGNPAPTSIFDTRFSAVGKAIGTQTVATNFGGAGGLALLVMPDGTLRLFASGAPVTGSATGGINTFTAKANGTGWTLDQGAVWGGPPADVSTMGATLTKDGQPVTGWGGNFQVGLAAGGSGTTACSCFTLQGDLATDAGSGAVAMSGLGQPSGYKVGGTFVEHVVPSVGGRVVLPSGSQGFGDSGISGRLGAPGVYVAYSDNTRSGVTKPAVRLYRYGGATRTIARGPFTIAKVFAGPEGRLWLVWGDAQDGVFVTRTNKAAGRLEPVQKLKAPPGAGFLWNADGEGSQGPLDLFVDADAGGRGFWHTHVLATFSLTAKSKRATNAPKATVTLSVRDAGDPVPGATISLKSGQKLTTDKQGNATLSLPSGHYSASASAGGYASVTAGFSVK